MGTTGRGGGGGAGAIRGGRRAARGGGLRTLGGGGLPAGTRIPANAQTFGTREAAARGARALLGRMRADARGDALQLGAIRRQVRIRPVRISRDDGTTAYTMAARIRSGGTARVSPAGGTARTARAFLGLLRRASGGDARRVTTGQGFQTFFVTR